MLLIGLGYVVFHLRLGNASRGLAKWLLECCFEWPFSGDGATTTTYKNGDRSSRAVRSDFGTNASGDWAPRNGGFDVTGDAAIDGDGPPIDDIFFLSFFFQCRNESPMSAADGVRRGESLRRHFPRGRRHFFPPFSPFFNSNRMEDDNSKRNEKIEEQFHHEWNATARSTVAVDCAGTMDAANNAVKITLRLTRKSASDAHFCVKPAELRLTRICASNRRK